MDSWDGVDQIRLIGTHVSLHDVTTLVRICESSKLCTYTERYAHMQTHTGARALYSISSLCLSPLFFLPFWPVCVLVCACHSLVSFTHCYAHFLSLHRHSPPLFGFYCHRLWLILTLSLFHSISFLPAHSCSIGPKIQRRWLAGRIKIQRKEHIGHLLCALSVLMLS